MDRFRKVPKCCTNSLWPCLTHKSQWTRIPKSITDVNPQGLSVPMLLDRECLRQVIATYMDKLSKNHPQSTMGLDTPSPCFQRVFSMLWYLDNFFDDIKHCFRTKISPEAEAYAACCKSRKTMSPQMKSELQKEYRHRHPSRVTRKLRPEHEQRLKDKSGEKENELRDKQDGGQKDTRNRDSRPIHAKPKWRLDYEQRLKDEEEAEENQKQLRVQQDSGQRDVMQDDKMKNLRRRQQFKRQSRAAKGIHYSAPHRDPTPEPPPMQEPEVNPEDNQTREKKLMRMFPRKNSTASIHTPFGKYMEGDKTKEESHRPNDLFGKMLKDAAAVVPEHHPFLKSTHALITSKDMAKLKGHQKPHQPQKGHKAYATPQSKDTTLPHMRTSYTKPLRDVLQGQAIAELVPMLRSSHRMDLEKKMDSKGKPTAGSPRQKRSDDSSKNQHDSKGKRTTGHQRLAGLKKRAAGSSKNKPDFKQISEDSPEHEQDSKGKHTTGRQGQAGPDSKKRSKGSSTHELDSKGKRPTDSQTGHKKRSKDIPKHYLGARDGRDSFDSFASANLDAFIKDRAKSNAELKRSVKNQEKKVNIAGPKFSKTFGKMLTGKAAAIPELHPVLKSFHNIRTAVDEEAPEHTRTHRTKQGKIISGVPAHIHTQKRNIRTGITVHAPKFRRRPMEPSSDVASMRERTSIGSLASILKPPSESVEKPREMSLASDNKASFKTHREKFKSAGNITRLGQQRFADYQPEKIVPYIPPIEHETDSEIFRHLLLGEGPRLPKEKIIPKNSQMKKFTFYIRGSKPDRKIMRREGSKHSISYLSPTRSLISRASWLSKKSAQSPISKGSVISIMDMAKAELPEKVDEIKEDTTYDEFDFVFGNMPDPFLTDNDPKSENSSPSAILSGPTSRRQSRSVHRTENTKEERAVLEAKIKKLMEHCAIREISQPKVKRNFVAEAIDRTYVPPPNKKLDSIKPRPRPRDKYPTTMELLKVPSNIEKWPTFADRQRQKYQAEMDKEWEYPLLEHIKPLKIRRYSDRTSDFLCLTKLLEHKKTPEAPPKMVEQGAGDSQAVGGDHFDCSICNRIGKHTREPDSPLIKKLKAQSRRFELRAYYRQMRQRELQRGLQTTPVTSCPSCLLLRDSLSHLLAQTANCF